MIRIHLETGPRRVAEAKASTREQGRELMLACAGKKRRENPKEQAHLHQRNQVFAISIMETLLNWVLLASL